PDPRTSTSRCRSGSPGTGGPPSWSTNPPGAPTPGSTPGCSPVAPLTLTRRRAAVDREVVGETLVPEPLHPLHSLAVATPHDQPREPGQPLDVLPHALQGFTQRFAHRSPPSSSGQTTRRERPPHPSPLPPS